MHGRVRKFLPFLMTLIMIVSLACEGGYPILADNVESIEQETETMQEEETLTPSPAEVTEDSIEVSEQTSETEEPVFTEQSITVQVQDASVTLSGQMPEGAWVEASPVVVEIEGQTVLAAYDITILDTLGQTYQPQNGAVRVEIASAAVAQAVSEEKKVSVYHMENVQDTPQEIYSSLTGNGVAFDAEHFSIYVVTEPETHYTVTYNFYDEEGTTLLNRQILSEDEVLQEPASPLKEHQVFDGWYTSANEDGSKFTDFGKTAGELTGESLNESKTVDLYARYRTVFYVFYMDGNSPDSNVLYTQTYLDGETVKSEEVPFNTDVDKALIGWSTDPAAQEPETELVIHGADMTLYPVVKAANWIIYNSQGGSQVEPAYVLSEALTKAPQNPVRAGYDFGGWYLEPECITPFEFGSPLENSITLYAKWNPATVNYQIVYWQQNPDDDGYTYESSDTQQGTTGTVTNVTADIDKYKGFQPSESKLIQQQNISGDGSTVVNVYYDRKVYKVIFYRWQSTPIIHGYWKEDSNLTIEAKYGADISDKWPSKQNPSYPANWRVDPTKEDRYQSGISTMPLDGAKFYYKEENGQYTIRLEYYLKDLTGKYVLDHADQFNSSNTVWKTTNEDYYEIKGFRVNSDKSPKLGAECEKLEGKYVYGWKFYYDRNFYNIDFMNGGVKDKTEEYLYQADISGAGYIPSALPGKEDYVFDGWYDNEMLMGNPFDFSGKVMPAGNMVLYAKWSAPLFTVTFDLNGASSQGDIYTPKTVIKGESVNKPEDPVWEGYSFAGWTRDGKPFNFNTRITEDTTLVAQWLSGARYSVTYEPNGAVDGEGTVIAGPMIDPIKYTNRAQAKLLSIPSDWMAPEEGIGFICWNTKADGSGMNYYPGDAYTMPADNVTLYAQWAPCRKTTLTYDFNGGKDPQDPSKGSETVVIDIPNDRYVIQMDGSTLIREGYYFAGWTVDQAGEGTLLKQGDYIQVDTLNPEKNILYAQWRKLFTVTVKKSVSGSMGNKLKEFDFSYTVTGPSEGNTDQTDKGSFQLADKGTYEIKNLKPGSKITVTEISPQSDGYTTQIVAGEEKIDNNKYTIENLSNDLTIEFLNKREVVPPTGVKNNMSALLIMLLTALAGAVLLFVPGRRWQ